MKVKELQNTSVARLIDWRTHQYIETLSFDEAVQKYGECEIMQSYTDKRMPDGKFQTSLWIKTEQEG